MPAPLTGFVTALVGHLDGASPAKPLDTASRLLAELVAADDWLPAPYARPDKQHYRQYLLYRDPRARFSVISFVWGPGQSTPVHDHTVWGAVGMLRGSELSQPFRRAADGTVHPAGPPRRLTPGEVERLDPADGDIHRVSNESASETAISIHVYGADIGAVDRSVFEADGRVKPFRSGYSNGPDSPPFVIA